MRIKDNTIAGKTTFEHIAYGQVYKRDGKVYMKTIPMMNRFENAVRLTDGLLVTVEGETYVECVDAWLTLE